MHQMVVFQIQVVRCSGKLWILSYGSFLDDPDQIQIILDSILKKKIFFAFFCELNHSEQENEIFFWTPALAAGSYEFMPVRTSVRALVTHFSRNWL